VRAGQRPVLARNRSTQCLRQTNASKPCSSRRPSAVRKFTSVHSFRCSSKSLLFPYLKRLDLTRRFGSHPPRAKSNGGDRLLLLLEQILEDELSPSAAACVHQRATLVLAFQIDGCEPRFLAKSATGAIASSSSLDRKTTRWPPLSIDRSPEWRQPGD